MEYSYAELEKAVRGKLIAPTQRRRFVGNVCLDSRTIKEGDLFVPLKGETFDGHDFIDRAFEKGARLCLAEYKSKWKIRRRDGDVIFVEDTLQALGRLAAFHRRKHAIPVIAITGSCGKTTTKEITAHLLKQQFRVLQSEGTENNFIGVPKTLLGLSDQEAAVIEMGTNRKGEIRYLSRIINPTHAVLTLIGNAHLTGFKNVDGVKQEKLSVIDALEDSATVIYNGDDKNIVHARFKDLKTVRAGFSKNFEYWADEIELTDEGVGFRLNGKEKVHCRLLGRHNVLNVLLACGAAVSAGLDPSRLKEGIESFTAPKGRVRYQEINGIHWIDDSYNSNPTSLRAAIELFTVYPPKGRKILVLGDMLELGERAEIFHREAGESLAGYAFDMVVTVGELSKEIALGAASKGFDKSRMKSFASSDDAARFLKGVLGERDTVLLKGSRGMRMEKILEHCSKS